MQNQTAKTKSDIGYQLLVNLAIRARRARQHYANERKNPFVLTEAQLAVLEGVAREAWYSFRVAKRVAAQCLQSPVQGQ